MTCQAWEGSLPSSTILTTQHVARYIMYNYFPHPSNLRQSSGCVSLLIEEGPAGYGIYLMALEVLRDAPNYRYSPDPKVWAFVLHSADIDMVGRVLKNYGLFDTDDNGLLYSPWLCSQLGDYDEVKRKRQEAGRKGAANRWHSKNNGDGNAIAKPSNGDGNAIAYNETQYNVTSYNDILPNPNGTERITEELIDIICKNDKEGFNRGYVAQELKRLGCNVRTLEILSQASEGCKLTNSTYQRFCAVIKRITAEKWHPDRPDAFIIRKVVEATD